MAALPYVITNKNLATLFEKINTAKIPETGFTHKFLLTTIGLKGTNDRAFIPLLRHLGFLDQSNIPTPSYRLLKGEKRKAILADGVILAQAQRYRAPCDVLGAELLKSKTVVLTDCAEFERRLPQPSHQTYDKRTCTAQENLNFLWAGCLRGLWKKAMCPPILFKLYTYLCPSNTISNASEMSSARFSISNSLRFRASVSRARSCCMGSTVSTIEL
jgi:hypothetical protein